MGETKEVQLSPETCFTIHMGEPQEVQLTKIEATGAKEENSLEDNSFGGPMNESTMSKKKRYYRWLRISIHSSLVLVCGSAAILLGRLYYEKGGKSKWMGTLVQLAGFPIQLPFHFISAPKNLTTNSSIHPKQSSASILAFIYVSIGLLLALDCYLYSVGLWYLPVSTYSLICSSQLAFNAFFSYFLNSLKFTPYIINSLVLLTISATLLVFQNESSSSDDDDSDSTQVSKKKYVIGFICTVGASAGYGLWLSLTQLVFKKVIKRETFKVVLDMILYTSLVATLATLVGLFASGEWSGLKNEMKEYELGKASYLLNLTFTAILWQVFTIGCLGLIREVSSLFSNAISALGVPIVPMLAVVFFHDKMDGIKGISMVLAIWGIISYVYQQYLDDSKSENRNTSHVPKASSPIEEVHR
ncbi:Purine permease 21 [Glycine soja]|uniref:Probable purine permease n=1 Tax=Glycine soja TaxID=3848 RepID=A0A445FQH9_GLYSO|nr:purine permease 21-like isoform X1 [Glycine soja]RZB51151.1 Purine permease 21 [Glycine soja]